MELGGGRHNTFANNICKFAGAVQSMSFADRGGKGSGCAVKVLLLLLLFLLSLLLMQRLHSTGAHAHVPQARALRHVRGLEEVRRPSEHPGGRAVPAQAQRGVQQRAVRWRQELCGEARDGDRLGQRDEEQHGGGRVPGLDGLPV